MKEILHYIKDYFRETDKRVILSVTFLTAILVFINYYCGLEAGITKNNSFTIKLIWWYAVFFAAFSIPYLFTALFTGSRYRKIPLFLFLLLLAPLLFAVKISLATNFNFPVTTSAAASGWNNYWNHIVYWPMLLLMVTALLVLLWICFDTAQPFYGITMKNLSWKPYFLLLLMMVPLVAAASSQADFLEVYPKLKSVTGADGGGLSWWHKLLFELSYGTDFITIELFFRGFLVLAFVKWAGKDAILPMACFYCTIHFGKPLGECISSYFGGIILGIVVYNTRSILGGLVVHLGIAWMMEFGGHLAAR